MFDTKKILLGGKKINNVYLLDILNFASSVDCILTKHEEYWLWHRRISDIHMHHLNKLISKDLVIGTPKLKFEKDHVCEACQKGKQVKNSFNMKNVVSTSKSLELFHTDLFGPSRTMSIGGNYYALVNVDDFSRFTWTLFLASKNDCFATLKKLAKLLKNKNNSNICSTISDHGEEFQNEKSSSFCEKYGIHHNFSAPGTP